MYFERRMPVDFYQITTEITKNGIMDTEMKEAVDELNQAQMMLDNASNKWRIDEAIARITAAHFRIQAIKYERGDVK